MEWFHSAGRRGGDGRGGQARPGSIRAGLAIAAAVALALGLGAGSLNLGHTNTVSAAQLLRRAAAAVTAQAGQVVHETSTWPSKARTCRVRPRRTRETGKIGCTTLRAASLWEPAEVTDGPPSGAATEVNMEQWTQVDGNRNPLQVDLTAAAADGSFSDRTVGESNGDLWYVSQTSQGDQATESSWTPGQPFLQNLPQPVSFLFLGKYTVDSPQSPGDMAKLLQQAAQTGAASGNPASIHELPPQTIDGQSYDVVQITLPKRVIISNQGDDEATDSGPISGTATVYIDPSTYLIRRIVSKAYDKAGNQLQAETIDITKYEIVELSAVPSGTFTYTPPPSSVATGNAACRELGSARDRINSSRPQAGGSSACVWSVPIRTGRRRRTVGRLIAEPWTGLNQPSQNARSEETPGEPFPRRLFRPQPHATHTYPKRLNRLARPWLNFEHGTPDLVTPRLFPAESARQCASDVPPEWTPRPRRGCPPAAPWFGGR